MKTHEILLSHGDEKEATSYPYWAIVRKGSFGRLNLLQGVWFNRKDAEKHLESRRHDYGDKAFVYCYSGYYSQHLREMYENARFANSSSATKSALEKVYEELEQRYDGAPDSTTIWMGEHVERIGKLLGK